MDTATARRKSIECPHCGKEQIIRLLAFPDKPALVIGKQRVLCLECEQNFDLLNESMIVDGPFTV